MDVEPGSSGLSMERPPIINDNESDSDYDDDDDASFIGGGILTLIGDDVDKRQIYQIIEDNYMSIKTYTLNERKIHEVYNYCVVNENLELVDVWDMVNFDEICQHECARGTFHLIVSLGTIFKNLQDESFVFYKACYRNFNYLDKVWKITNEKDFKKASSELRQTDPYTILERPHYYLQPILITNVQVSVMRKDELIIGGYSCGCPIQSKLVNHNSIITFHQSTDDCLFRCIAYFQRRQQSSVRRINTRRLDRLTIRLKREFYQAKGYLPSMAISLKHIPEIEEHFKVKISIYQMTKFASIENNSYYEYRNHATIRNYPEMKLNISFCKHHPKNAHFSYISRWSAFPKQIVCPKCQQCFVKKRYLTRHLKRNPNSCFEGKKNVYKCKVFAPNDDDIFSRLQRAHFISYLPEHRPQNNFFAVFDFECLLKCVELRTKNTNYVQQHVAVSCCIATNVPGYDDAPISLINNDPNSNEELVKNFVQTLHKISDKAYSLLKEKYTPFMTELKEKLSGVPCKCFDKVFTQVHKTLRILPVISFNGGSYDINVIKEPFFRHLKATSLSVIKRGNSYMLIGDSKIRCLDITNYIRRGVSYRTFLEMFQSDQRKAFFPYDYMTDLERLNETALPSRESFFNKLTNQHISIEDYQACQQIWRDNNMNTLRDYLLYYNSLDVVPFLKVVETMLKLYLERGVHLFRDSLSSPGVSIKLMFKDVREPYLTPSDDIVHKMFRDGILGGLSTIFVRKAVANSTRIKPLKYGRKTAKLCSKVMGFDANALYGFALLQDSPAGLYVHRQITSDGVHLSPTHRGRYTKELQWLICLEWSRNVKITSSLSPGGQYYVNHKYRCDGVYYDSDTGEHVLLEFFGCYWHSCNSCPVPQRPEVYEATVAKLNELRQLPNVRVEFLWEHDFEAFMNALGPDGRTHRQFLHATIPPSMLYNQHLKASSFLDKVISGSLFGLVRCSVNVHESYHDYYDEYPPIFKIKTITKDDVEGVMKEYVEKTDCMKQSRTMLISCMSAQKQVFITPVLRWYISENNRHNFRVFEITDISEFIEFVPTKSFAPFIEKGTSDRIKADVDPAFKVNSLISKEVINSSYGRCLMNRDKHTKTSIVVNDDNKLYKMINSPRFKCVDELSYDCFEIDSELPVIHWDHPQQVGVFVYAYAKLHMLRFFYQFIKEYIDDRCFALLMSDTDSYYFALSEQTLDECVKEGKREAYEKVKNHWLATGADQQRTPGLFKVEFEGNRFIGLNSKTYCVEGTYLKVGAKGVSKVQNKLLFKNFDHVLKTSKSFYTQNRNFTLKDNQMYTSVQTKPGLQNLYIKRRVLPDNIHTKSLIS